MPSRSAWAVSVAMTSSASKPSSSTHRDAQGVEHLLDQADLALELVGRLGAVGLVLGVLLGAEGLRGHVEGDREVGRQLVAQRVDEHRGEAVDRVGRLTGRGREVLHRQRVEGAVGQRVAVEQEQPAGRLVGAVECVGHPPDPSGGRRHRDARRMPDAAVTTSRRCSSTRDPPAALLEHMGIELIEATPERVVATMPVEGNTQPYGLLHGGASRGARGDPRLVRLPPLHAGPDRVAVGIEINATHHRAARSGIVTGVATPSSSARTLATCEVVIERRRRPAHLHRTDHLPAARRGRQAPDSRRARPG